MTVPPILLFLVGAGLVTILARAVRVTWLMHRLGGDPRKYDMPRVASYAHAVFTPVELMPDQTWADLDMDEVFQKLDRTVSWPGQHVLYARLRREGSFELLELEREIASAASDEPSRLLIRGALAALESRRASALPALFLGEPARRPPLMWLYPIISASALACTISAFWWPKLVVAVVGLALMNAFLRAWLRDHIDRVVPAIRTLPLLVDAAAKLMRMDGELSVYAERLRVGVPRLAWVSRVSRWLSFEPTGGNELANFVYEMMNLMYLLDVNAYAWSIEAIAAQRSVIAEVYATLGHLDTVQALATLRAERTNWCRPQFAAPDSSCLSFSGLTHPLVVDAISNSLAIHDASVLLTGSNMSGKSTFVRAIGVNAILAQSINTVFATGWSSTPLALRTSIRRADSLTEGKSYYRAEVDGVGSLLTSGGGRRRLILIDELFRGTNSVERVAAAKAVLAFLGATTDIVIVATHDLELLELLPDYRPYHFREEVRDEQLYFDYQLHEGPCPTRNAIAILELVGYPESVVADARATAARLVRTQNRLSFWSR